MEEERCSERRACRTLSIHRSAYHYRPKENEFKRKLFKRVEELTRKHPRYGYRRIARILQREGWHVGKNQIQRIRRKAGLQVSRKKKRKRAMHGKSADYPVKAKAPRHVWSWDIVHDQTDDARGLRVLTMVDEFTKECPVLYVGRNINAQVAISVIASAIMKYGAPAYIRSDNGSEFIAEALQKWLKKNKIKTAYIAPGSPWENGYIESFNGKLRDECLDREIFYHLLDARVVVEEWRVEYNERRPHSSLDYATPSEFAKRWCVENDVRRHGVKIFAPHGARRTDARAAAG